MLNFASSVFFTNFAFRVIVIDIASDLLALYIITNTQGQTSNRPLENSQAAGRWRTSRAANMFAALLIIEMLMNCIFNQINRAFHNYLSLYIGDNDNIVYIELLFICGPCSNICILHPRSARAQMLLRVPKIMASKSDVIALIVHQ